MDSMPLFNFSFQKTGGYGFSLIGEILEGTAGLALMDINSKVLDVLSIDDFEESILKFVDKECFYFNIHNEKFVDYFMEYVEENNVDTFSKISDLFLDFSHRYNIEFQHIKNYY